MGLTDYTKDIDHFLGNARKLDSTTLASVTDEDIAAYTAEYEGYRENLKTLKSEVATKMSKIQTDCNEIWGYDSKESRYFNRATQKQEDIGSVYDSKYCSPDYIMEMVEIAKVDVSVNDLKRKDFSNTEESLSEINKATEYLLENGYKLNKDFSLGSAVGIAKAHHLQDLTMVLASAEEFGELLNVEITNNGKQCEECPTDRFKPQDSNNLTVSCGCGSETYSVRSDFDDNGLAYTLHEEA